MLQQIEIIIIIILRSFVDMNPQDKRSYLLLAKEEDSANPIIETLQNELKNDLKVKFIREREQYLALIDIKSFDSMSSLLIVLGPDSINEMLNLAQVLELIYGKDFKRNLIYL